MGQVGSLALGIVGGILGTFVGMPQLGFLASSLLGSALFASSSTGKGGPKLADLHVTSSTYGNPIIWGWGTCRIGGNVIWSYPLTQHEHQQGKGIGGGTYTYSWTGGVALCSTEFTGPIDKILKIWADTKLVYDATGQSGITQNIPGSGGGKGGGNATLPGSSVINGNVTSAFNKVGKFRVYQGTQTQMPDPALEALVGAANATAHRGMAVVVFEDVDLTNYGMRVPNWTFEVAFTASIVAQNQFGFDETGLSGVNSTDAALDSFRRRAYFLKIGNAFRVNDLVTGNVVTTSTVSRTANGASRNYEPGGMIIGDDGYLWVNDNLSAYCKIDPDSMLEVGTIAWGHAPTSVVPLRLSGENCLFLGCFEGLAGRNLGLLGCDSMSVLASGTYPSGQIRVCGGNQVDSDVAKVFGITFPRVFGPGSQISLYSINLAGANVIGGAAITTNLIVTLNPSDIDSDWSNFTDCRYLVFDATDGNVMFFVVTTDSVSAGHAKQYFIKVSTVDGSVLWKVDYSHTPGEAAGLPFIGGATATQTIVSSGIFAFLDGHNQMWTVNTQDGTSTTTLWSGGASHNTFIWNDQLGALMIFGSAGGTFSSRWGVLIATQSGDTVPLSTPVSQICAACGLTGADIDVSTLTDNVQGYILTNQMKGKEGITPLALAYLFDAAESDNIIKFVKRGGASVKTIPADDFAVIDAKNGLYVQEQRTQELDLPSQVSINFLDPNHNYQQATQYARRNANPYPTTLSKQTHTESIPLVAQPGFMKQLAEKLLFSTWIERVGYKTKCQWENIILDPTDVVTITLPDASTVVTRISQQALGADYSVEQETLSESGASYSSTATTDGGLGFNQQQIALPVTTKLFLLDMPLLRDVDDTGQSYTILYDAAAGYGGGATWPGAAIQKSNDNTTFSSDGSLISSQAVSWGTATNALGDTGNPYTIDYVNTLTVQMATGTAPVSDTLVNVCNGTNVGVLVNQATNTLEIIQWLVSTPNVDGTYTLSQLLRGRRGTEVFTDNHQIGDLFVVLTTTTVSSVKMALSDLNVGRYFKAITTGTLAINANSQSLTSQGRPLKPYAPEDVTCTLSGSDIDIGWVRRTRVGGELMPLTGIVPLSEQFESYEVDIYNALGDTVLRTLRVDYGATPTTSPGVTYLAADIATDFGSTPTTLNVAVYQISGVAGRGFARLKTVTVM